MEQLLLLLLLAFFSVEMLGAYDHNHEIEMYWQSVLPNAVMPKSLKDLIQYGRGDNKVEYHFVLEDSDEVVQDINLGYNANIVPNFNLIYGGVRSSQWSRLINPDNQTLYFFEEDLRQGMKMNLGFVSDNKATFLPRQVANSIPFTSNKLPQILEQLSIKPGLNRAKLLNTTIIICEQPSIKAEHKYCATSLESMIDFSVSRLGKNVQVLATELNGKGKSQTQSYALVQISKARDKSVVCHKVTYAYAVYLCHEIPATKSYVVSLVGADGSKVKALAVCHVDTSAWDPDFPAFKILEIKPGDVPICHFLVKDTVVWVPN